MQSTSMLTPSTSDARMNSWRLSVHILPVRVSQSIAVIHSSSVGSISRTKACRCPISAPMIRRRRGSGMFFHRWLTISVSFFSVTNGMSFFPVRIEWQLALARSSLRAAAVKRRIEQRTDAGTLDGTRIEIRLLGRELGGAIESGFGHADVLEGERGAKAFHQIINPLRGLRNIQCALGGSHGRPRGVVVIRHRVRQDNGVGLGMRQVPGAAQHVTKLVMQRHADRAE